MGDCEALKQSTSRKNIGNESSPLHIKVSGVNVLDITDNDVRSPVNQTKTIKEIDRVCSGPEIQSRFLRLSSPEPPGFSKVIP